MNIEEVAKQSIDGVGGKSNILSATNCATRLRFRLKDFELVNDEENRKIDGIIDTRINGDEYQLIIGPEVNQVYRCVSKLLDSEAETAVVDKKEEQTEKQKLSFFNLISGTFTPLLPVLIACGMLQAIVQILLLTKVLAEGSGAFAVLQAAGNAAFYFIPIFIGFSLAKKLEINPYMGALIGATLLEPNFAGLAEAGTKHSFFGIPLIVQSYSATIIPIFAAVLLLYVVENFLKKHVWKELQMVLVPTLCILVVVPITVLLFGPAGYYAGELLTKLFTILENTNSALMGVVIAGLNFPMVIAGLNWTLVPLIINNIGALGGDPILAMASCSNFAAFGIAFGVFLRSKDKNLKSVGGSTAITGLLAGVSEPILYGIVLRYRRLIPMLVASAAVGGGIVGLFKVKALGFSLPNLLAIPAFVPSGLFIVGIAVSFVMATALVYFFGYEDKKVKEDRKGEMVEDENYQEA